MYVEELLNKNESQSFRFVAYILDAFEHTEGVTLICRITHTLEIISLAYQSRAICELAYGSGFVGH